MGERERISVVTPPDKDVPVAWEMAARIIQAEETARAIARGAKVQKSKIELPETEVPKTHTVDKKEFSIEGDYSLLDITNRGELREVLVLSPSDDFSVLILGDGVKKLERSFTDLEDIAEELEFLSVFEKNGTYVLHVKNFSWQSTFLFLIRADPAISFTRLFAVWTEYIK